ncbi:hypothetical protein ABZT26_28135 [Streptomyces sp. NPDC005395]|uniref:hypothetical protein n=1 Tax=unclassified Streptomyces TaxID=2593676 RepID=UPI0033BA1C71
MFAQASWPTFTIPLRAGHRFHIVYRTFEEDEGVDYLLHHPDWDLAELLATEESHFMGPGLSWPELVAAADNALPGGTTTAPHARLLLLLPALGDDAPPNDAKDRLAAALRAHTKAEAADTLAAALLETQGLWGPTRWTTTERGVRISDGEYSVRNPANLALSPDRLASIPVALSFFEMATDQVTACEPQRARPPGR